MRGLPVIRGHFLSPLPHVKEPVKHGQLSCTLGVILLNDTFSGILRCPRTSAVVMRTNNSSFILDRHQNRWRIYLGLKCLIVSNLLLIAN